MLLNYVTCMYMYLAHKEDLQTIQLNQMPLTSRNVSHSGSNVLTVSLFVAFYELSVMVMM